MIAGPLAQRVGCCSQAIHQVFDVGGSLADGGRSWQSSVRRSSLRRLCGFQLGSTEAMVAPDAS